MHEAWDRRIARYLVRPLVGTYVTPNHLTSVRLAVGLAGVIGLSVGDYFWANLGAIGFAFSNFLDHADGELARISGQLSEWGHYYDLFCDALIHTLLFVCIGVGLSDSFPRGVSILMGFIAGISVSSIFWFRMKIEDRRGKQAVPQLRWAGFEMEDIMYLVPFVALLEGLQLFLTLAATISPGFAVFFGWQYFRAQKTI